MFLSFYVIKRTHYTLTNTMTYSEIYEYLVILTVIYTY